MHNKPTWTYCATSASSYSTSYACSSNAAILANEAKNKVILPRLINPAAASEISSNMPTLLFIPPLAYESTVSATISTPICTASCQVKRGQRKRNGMNDNTATARYNTLVPKNRGKW